MRIVLIGQLIEQLGDVIATVQGRQIPRSCAESAFEFGFRQQVQHIGRFAEEHYATDGKEVKSSLERALGTTCSLRQSRQLADLAAEKRDDEARLAKLDHPQNDC